MHNYLRALYLDNLETLGLSYLRAYESAYSRLQTLLKNIEYAKDEYLHFCVAQNAILVLCVMGRFSEALVLMQKEKVHFNTACPILCLHRIVCIVLAEKNRRSPRSENWNRISLNWMIAY